MPDRNTLILVIEAAKELDEGQDSDYGLWSGGSQGGPDAWAQDDGGFGEG